MPKKSKRTPQPKIREIPPFDKSRAKNYPVETSKTTYNPTGARRVQDLAGVNKSKAIGLVFDASAMTGRSDKGKKRGPNTGRSRRLSIQELPETLYRVSQGRQEGIRGYAGGVRQYGHTLRTSIPDTPVGGWGGLDPNQFDTASSTAGTRSRRGTSGTSATRESLEQDLEKGRSNLRVKVIKLDAPENDPKNYSDARLDELVIERIQRRKQIDNDTAERQFIALTEQAKQKLRDEERQSLELEKKKQKQRLEADLDRLADTQVELEQVIAEEERALSGEGARLGSETIRDRRQRLFKAKIQLMREFGQIETDTAEGKFRLASLIDDNITEGLLSAEESTRLKEEMDRLRPQPEPEREEPVVSVQQSGPITRRPAVLRLKDAFSTGAKAVSDLPVSKGIVRELGGISEGASNLVGAVREAELARRGRSQAEQERIRLGSRFKEQFGEDSRRLEEAIARKFPKKEEEEGLNKQLNDRYYLAIKEADLAREARARAEDAREADKKLTRELDRAEKLQRFRNRNRYGNQQSRFNKQFQENVKRRELVSEFVDDVIEGTLDKMFPAEEKTERQKRVSIKSRERRRDPAEIYSGINPSAVGNIADKERKELDEFRKQKSAITEQAHTKARQFLLDKKLKEQDPRFMSDDDLEAKAKAVSQRLRDEERRSQALVDDIMGGQRERTINFNVAQREETRTPTPVLKLKPQPQPEPEVAEEDDDDDEFQDALDFTPAQMERYKDAEHFGHKGLSERRVKTISEMEADLKRARQRAEMEKKNYYDKLLSQQGPEPPPRPPTEIEEFLEGIDEDPPPERKAPELPPRPPREIATQTNPPLPPRPQSLPTQAEIAQRARASENQKPSQQRYARSSGSYLSDMDRDELKVLKDELISVKGFLDTYGFPRGLLGSTSKADRDRKDKDLAIKLSQLRNSADYDKIQQAVARAIQLNKRIQQLNVKDAQLKKKKK